MRWLERAWRTAATHACFAVYIPGSLILGFPASVAVHLLVPAAHRGRVGKWLLRRWYSFFVGMMTGVGVLEVERRDLELLRRPGLFIVANHPTLIDFPLLGALLPSADCLVKASLLGHWAMRWPVLMGGYITNDQGEHTLALCRTSLLKGNSIVVFPEGTRSPPGRPLRFQRGAAQLALRCASSLVLVRIESTVSNLHKGGRWWLAPPRKVRMRVSVSEEVDMGGWLERCGGEASLAARELTKALEGRYNEELERAKFGE